MRGIAALLTDPLVVVDRSGRVIECNRAARTLLGDAAVAAGAAPFEADAALRRLIADASAGSAPVPGAVTVNGTEGTLGRFKARAVLLDRSDPRLPVAVQLRDTRQDEFAVLSGRVEELNREIARRRAVQARLEESLQRNAILFRELQHRVKNHLQMTLSLFAVSRRETCNPDALVILERMEAKLRVVAEAQRLMYSQEALGVQADQLLESVVSILSVLAGDGIAIEVDARPVQVSNDVAFPLALIANELLSNAVKYGVPGHAGRIAVSLEPAGADLVLAVRDWGAGFAGEGSGRRSSGLGLVRGLCRQIGGRLEIDGANGEGTAVRVVFPPGAST